MIPIPGSLNEVDPLGSGDLGPPTNRRDTPPAPPPGLGPVQKSNYTHIQHSDLDGCLERAMEEVRRA
jgi:hypothetical protein